MANVFFLPTDIVSPPASANITAGLTDANITIQPSPSNADSYNITITPVDTAITDVIPTTNILANNVTSPINIPNLRPNTTYNASIVAIISGVPSKKNTIPFTTKGIIIILFFSVKFVSVYPTKILFAF